MLLFVVLCRLPDEVSTIVLPSLRVQVLVPTGGMLKLCRTDFSASYEPHAYLMHYTFIDTPKLCSVEIGCWVGAMWLQVCFAAIWLFAAVRQEKGH